MEIESPNHSNSSRRSPEFEFWMVNNHPELEQVNLHTADELFIDGVILPLHLLSISHHHPHKSTNSKQKENATAAIHPEASILSTSSTTSKRWKDMFRKKDCTPPVDEKVDKKKEKRAGETTTQLNINIWPFSRSRSAGTAAAAGKRKPAAAVAARKSSSAPCSRSNSRGESTARWAASPGRPGIYVGRASPVWPARRKGPGFGSGTGPGTARPREKGRRGGGGGVKGLNLNVNSCIGGYGRCVDEEERVGGSLFRFRGLFSKKVY